MDGIIIINKPKNCTSHDIVRKAKKILNEKVGHTGTLDPNATGVLPLLVGKGTQISKYIINHDKTYEAVLQLGEKTDTADIEGEVIETKPVTVDCLRKEYVTAVLKKMEGKQEQIPPMYSAIKINGKKLYEYARKGEMVKIEPRKIEIYSLELININEVDKQIEFRVSCSKGTYIRTLCENIAEKLGTVGHMKELKRTQVGEFKIDDAITIEELEQKLLEFKRLIHDKDDSELLLEFDVEKINVKAHTKLVGMFCAIAYLYTGLDVDGIIKKNLHQDMVNNGIENIKRHLDKEGLKPHRIVNHVVNNQVC